MLVGSQLLGDGSRAGTATLQGETDEAGAFALAGAGVGRLVAMAEHATAGRSAPVPVPEGPEEPPPLALVVEAVASLSGRVRLDGVAAAQAAVVAAREAAPRIEPPPRLRVEPPAGPGADVKAQRTLHSKRLALMRPLGLVPDLS